MKTLFPLIWCYPPFRGGRKRHLTTSVGQGPRQLRGGGWQLWSCRTPRPPDNFPRGGKIPQGGGGTNPPHRRGPWASPGTSSRAPCGLRSTPPVPSPAALALPWPRRPSQCPAGTFRLLWHRCEVSPQFCGHTVIRVFPSASASSIPSERRGRRVAPVPLVESQGAVSGKSLMTGGVGGHPAWRRVPAPGPQNELSPRQGKNNRIEITTRYEISSAFSHRS